MRYTDLRIQELILQFAGHTQLIVTILCVCVCVCEVSRNDTNFAMYAKKCYS